MDDRLRSPFDDTLVRPGALVDLHRHLPEDREAFIRWYSDPDIATLLRHDLRPLTYIQARGYFDNIVLPASDTGTAWAIHQRDPARLIGTTAVTQIDRAAGTCLFRIVIGERDAWGHGLGTDATRLVIEEVFGPLGLDTIRLEVFEHNPRAQAVYHRLGFVETGRSVEWARHTRLDVIAMRLTRERWESLQQAAGRTES